MNRAGVRAAHVTVSSEIPCGTALDVTVVVPTFNRVATLVPLLEALMAQEADGLAFEVVVVDNGSRDATREAVLQASARDLRIRYVAEPRTGASFARNTGIACARGAIVGFLDDDVLPARDWISELKRAFDAHPEVDCVGGRVEPRWTGRVPQWLTPAHCSPLAVQIDRPPDFDADHAAACLIAANFACRRRVFDEVGGFSTAFQRDEDRELNLRLWRAGKRGRYVDAVRAVAPVEPERLTKRYHRRWYETTGRNHARMQFREIIDRDGRLVPAMTGRRLFGAPAFLYRECLREIWRWAVASVRGARADAFLAECRVRYCISYIRERAQVLLRASA